MAEPSEDYVSSTHPGSTPRQSKITENDFASHLRKPPVRAIAAEPLLTFPRGALVHFAVSNSEGAISPVNSTEASSATTLQRVTRLNEPTRCSRTRFGA